MPLMLGGTDAFRFYQFKPKTAEVAASAVPDNHPEQQIAS
jgi:hypothetical protein